MKSIEWYKETYGVEGENEFILKGKILVVPYWCVRLLLTRVGLKSKKSRIVNKVLKRHIRKAIKFGLEAERVNIND